MKKILVLGIETSCDETSAAIVAEGKTVLSSVVSSQAEFHKKYGGVVPEIASRKHVELFNVVLEEALYRAGVGYSELNAVSVTKGPGLIGALMVGMAGAKAVAFSANLPLIAVNHIEGHIYSVFLENEVKLPLLCLVVSGGHTSLIAVDGLGRYRELGKTLDDAAGEAYDKVAKALELGYPGGPLIEKLAEEGDPSKVKFPQPLKEKGNYNFSFSGLKTSVIYYLRDNPDARKADIASSFEFAVINSLTQKTIEAAKEYGFKNIAVAGGVSANEHLKKNLSEKAKEQGLEFYSPSKSLATDNAVMIAGAAFYKLTAGKISGFEEDSDAAYPLS